MHPQLLTSLRIYWQRVDKKAVGLLVIVLVLIGFADTLLALLGHILHMMIELVESALEHLLETAFGLSSRQAQMVLFYSWLLITLYLTWRLLHKMYFIALSLYETLVMRWQATTHSAKTIIWFRGMTIIGILGMGFYLFT